MKSTAVMGWLALFMSLAIAACAAYFSIAGLAVLFAAALIPVIIMATTLEIGKLVATFFLHRFWEELPGQIKYPMTMMVVILMLITSMGIFGFLSKGHIEQEAPEISMQTEIDNVDNQIGFHKGAIKDIEKDLAQIRESLDRYTELGAVTKGLAAREKLQKDIDGLREKIAKERKEIRTLEEEKLNIRQRINEIEAKLGPVKYVAELFGFDLKEDPQGKGKAVRIVIVLFMLAFDPLAIWLVMASDWAFLKYRREREELGLDEKEEEERQRKLEEEEQRRLQKIAEKEKELEEKLSKKNLTKEEEMTELEEALVQVYHQLEEKEMELKEYTAILEELGRTLDEKPTEIEKIVEIENTEKLEEMVAEINQLESQKINLEQEMESIRASLMTKEQVADELKQALVEVRNELESIRQENNALRSDIEARDNAVASLNKKYNLVEKIPGMVLRPDTGTPKDATFGTDFPSNPVNGQQFLRVDELPSKLYKYDGSRWVEVVKDVDVEYDEQYLQHLINELGEGNVELDDLSQKEQEEIQALLSKDDVLGQ